MTAIVTQDRVILYAQPQGSGTAMKPLSIECNGMADKTHPGPAREVTWGRDEFGRYIPKLTILNPPGGLNTSTIEEDDQGTFSYLLKMFDRIGCFPIQERWYKCGLLTGGGWTRVHHFGKMTITQKVLGAGPSREATGAGIFGTFEVAWPYTIALFKHALAALVTGEINNLNALAVLSDLFPGCTNCAPGYEPDEIIYTGGDTSAGSPGDRAELHYSTNGGGTFSVTSTDPFAAGVDIKHILINFINESEFRVIVFNGEVTGQEKYSDFTLGAEGVSAWSTAVNVGAAAVTAAEWLFYDRIYASSAGDIYISGDQGETYGAATYTGAVNINAFAKSPTDGSVWAVGDSNLVLQEIGQAGVFTAKVGPTGGGAFSSVFVANDGSLYAGNATSVFVSTNNAANVGGWTLLKNFGANKKVISINCAGGSKSQGGDSQLLRVVIDDTTGAIPGAVWESVDGGNSFYEVTTLTNTGYNECFWSPIDDNLAFICGDDGVFHKLEPKAI